ncbi:hypothetical protein EEL31_19615 [Brevibacillus laterosporus]|nr:hypothetical protein [Brevibacillus laterosporus]TPG70484.1 hypothetical protein EEL31_19615 [Brevibacillus laterosporus]
MKKNTMFGTLALACVLSGVSVMPTFVEANNVKQAGTDRVEVTSIKSSAAPQALINPMESRKVIKNQKLANNTEMTESFYVNPSFGWVKVWVENTGSKAITIVVTDEDGKEKMSGTVKPGKTWEDYSSKPWGVGDYKISFTSSRADMEGRFSVRIANTKKELD